MKKEKEQQELHIEMESNKYRANGILKNEERIRRNSIKKKLRRKQSDTSIKYEAIAEPISANAFTHSNGIYFFFEFCFLNRLDITTDHS